MGPQAEDYIETVLTCEGDYYDPEFHAQLQQFSRKLEQLIVQDQKKKKLILKKVEPWNSVRVTFNIPKEAALRLKCLAEQGDVTLKELGILAVEIEGDRKISLKIAGRNNETTELIFSTGDRVSKATVNANTSTLVNANTSTFETNSSDDMNIPGPSAGSVESTRINIQDYLEQGAAHLIGSLLSTGSNTPSFKVEPVGTGNQAHFISSQGAGLGIPSQMSPKFPTPPPSVSTPNSPNAKGASFNAGMGASQANLFGNNPTVQTMVKQLLGSKGSSASPLLVNLLQNDLAAAGNLPLNIAQALSSTYPQAVNSVFQQNMNKLAFPQDEGAAPVPQPPKKKRKPRKPKDKDGQLAKKQKPSPQNESTIIQNILSQAVGNSTQQQDPRVPPLGAANQNQLFTGTEDTPSKASTPSSSRAATPAKSPCPATPKSPIHGQQLAPGQRHIINPTTGQLELVEEDIGVTPPKRDFPPKENKILQYTVPLNPITALHQQSYPLCTDSGSPGRHQISSPSTSLSVIKSEGNDSTYVPPHTSMAGSESKYSNSAIVSSVGDEVLLTSGYPKTCQSSVLFTSGDNPLISSISQTVSNSNVASMPQTISAILSNVSKSGSIALATLNLPAVQDSIQNAAMQSKPFTEISSLQNVGLNSAVPKGTLAVPSTVSTVTDGMSGIINKDISMQNSGNISYTIPVLSGINSVALPNTSLTVSTSLSTNSAFKNSGLNIELPSALNSAPLSTTSQTVGNSGSISQGKGAIDANNSNVGPKSNLEVETSENCLPLTNDNSVRQSTHAHSVQKSVLEQGQGSLSLTVGTHLNITGINGGSNIESNSQTPSELNELTNPHHHDSEHSSQSCEDHGKHGSVDSGLGDIKENNGESPSGSSSNDSPGVTVSSSGNRDSDTEKEKDFSSQSEKNVITVGYVLSKSENLPVEKSVCDNYVKCNHSDIESVIQKPLFNKTESSSSSKNNDMCDRLLNMPTLLKLPPTSKVDSSVHDESLSKSLNWIGRSDLNPGGIPNGQNFNLNQLPPTSKVAAENEICEDRSSLVQVCSNDAKVLTKTEEKPEPHSAVRSSQNKDQTNPKSPKKPPSPNHSVNQDMSYKVSETDSKLLNPSTDTIEDASQKDDLFFTHENVLIDHVHDIHSYSDIKVTDDNTVIIDIKDSIATNATSDSSNEIVYDGDFEMKNNVVLDLPIDLQARGISIDTMTFEHSKDNTNSTKPAASLSPNHDNSNAKPKTFTQATNAPGINLSIECKNQTPTTAYENCQVNVHSTSTVTDVIMSKFLTENIKISTDSNLNVEKLASTVYSPSLDATSLTVSTKSGEEFSTSVTLISTLSSVTPSIVKHNSPPSLDAPSLTVSTKTSEELSTHATLISTISSVAPSIGNLQNINKVTTVSSFTSQGQPGMANLAPSPIMSTGLPYFSSTTTAQGSQSTTPTSELISDKVAKANLQKGISIMKPLRDRESSIDEDLLESPIKDKNLSPRKTEKNEKPIAASTVSHNKRTNFTVAQLLDEADKVKQNQHIFKPYVGSDKNENLFTPVSITASAALKQMAKNVDDTNAIIKSDVLEKSDIVNKTVPNMLKTVTVNSSKDDVCSSSIIHSCSSSTSLHSQASTGAIKTQEALPSALSTKRNKSNSVIVTHPSNVSITSPEFLINLSESVHQVMKAVQPLSTEDTSPHSVSPNLVSVNKSNSDPVQLVLNKTLSENILSQKCDENKTVNNANKVLRRTVSPPKQKQLVALSKVNIQEKEKLETSSKIKSTIGGFIKIEPEPKMPVTVKNVINVVKSSLAQNVSNVDGKSVERTPKVSTIVSSETSIVSINKGVKRVKHIPDVQPSTVIDLRSQVNNVFVHEHSYSARPNQLQKVPVYHTQVLSATHIPCDMSTDVTKSVADHNSLGIANELTSVNYAMTSNSAIKPSVIKSLSTRCTETISGSKNVGKTIHTEGKKTLTISGGRSESNETTKVTLDLRSAVTHPSSASKFIRLEPGKDWGPSSINKVSNITVKVKGEVQKQENSPMFIRQSSNLLSDKTVTSVSDHSSNNHQVFVQAKSDVSILKPHISKSTCNNISDALINVTAPPAYITTENYKSTPQNLIRKRKSLDSDTSPNECNELQPPAKSFRMTRRRSSDTYNDLDSIVKPAARITRRSSRGSTDSKASSTDGNRAEESLTAHAKPSLRKNRAKTTSESSEFAGSEQFIARRNSCSSAERSMSPFLHQTRNSKNGRRKVNENDKSPENIDDQVNSVLSTDNNARSTRSSKRKLPSTEEKDISSATDISATLNTGKTVESVLSLDNCTTEDKAMCSVEEKSDIDIARKVSNRVRNVKPKHIVDSCLPEDPVEIKAIESEKLNDARDNSTSKRSTRSTRSVEHCELPNNYAVKKKPKAH